jgi:hypothetical protein
MIVGQQVHGIIKQRSRVDHALVGSTSEHLAKSTRRRPKSQRIRSKTNNMRCRHTRAINGPDGATNPSTGDVKAWGEDIDE